MILFFKFLGNFTLFLLAPFLEWLLMPFNVLLVFIIDWKKKGFKGAVIGIANYFRESALRKDIYCCSEYRTLWNCTLKVREGKKIGVNNRSLSADIGEQEVDGTMSRTGAIINAALFLIERNHCRKALDAFPQENN